MVVDGYWLVRPGQETVVETARARYHRTNVGAVVAGVIGATAVLVVGYALVLPWVNSLQLEHVNPFVLWFAPLGAAFIGGALVWWVISGLGERRWNRLKNNPALMRGAWAYRDAYGTVPDTVVPVQDLWDGLDHPGDLLHSELHARILAALPRAGGAAPTS